MKATKNMKVTKKYCAGLLERHDLVGEIADNSEQLVAEHLVEILKSADNNSRFRVSYDPMSYGTDDEDTWDLVGPGVPYGRFYYLNREDAEADRDALNSILREHFGPVTRQAEYTSDAHAARCVIDNRNHCCPACGSNEIELDESAFLGPVCTLRRGCSKCNAEWVENYVLQGYHDLRMD